MEAEVKWIENRMFLGESGSGHTVVIDGPPAAGGRNIGVRPMELILLGVGGCISFDVLSILEKSRQDVHDCRLKLDAERSDSVPAVFTKIHIHFIVAGNKLKPTRVKRAIELAAAKYCSASIMLGRGGVEITHSFEIIAAA